MEYDRDPITGNTLSKAGGIELPRETPPAHLSLPEIRRAPPSTCEAAEPLIGRLKYDQGSLLKKEMEELGFGGSKRKRCK